MKFQNRHTYIGASEAAPVLGLSRWATPMKVWAEKTKQVPDEDTSNKLPVKLGNMLEDTVAELFMEETGKKVRRVTEPYTHKKYDFLKCHIDRKVEGEKSILQCKTCSTWKSAEWQGEEIPQEYIIQEYHELACSGYDKAYIAVLIGNEKFVIKELLRDEGIINDIIKKEVDFWNNFVIPKIMPAENIKHNDNDVLYKLFPNAVAGKEISLPDEANLLKENIDAFNRDIKMSQKYKEEAQNRLKAMIKENEIGNTGVWHILWKNVHTNSYSVSEKDYRKLSFKKIK